LSSFIGDHPKSRLVTISSGAYPRVKIEFDSTRKKWAEEVVEAADFIAVKSYKARGKRLTTTPVKSITQLEPIKEEEPVEVEPLPEPVDEDAQEIQKMLFDIVAEEKD
jgi:topoisomerase-4 subunit A